MLAEVQYQGYVLCCCPSGLGHNQPLFWDGFCPCMPQALWDHINAYDQINATWPLPTYCVIREVFLLVILKSWKYLQEYPNTDPNIAPLCSE